MHIYLMTDLEGVAGVQNALEWTRPGQPFYPLSRQLLTREVNAAVEGFLAGGATAVLVVDGHGPGAVDIQDLDSRARFMRGWPQGWPLGLEEGGYDAVAWVGQHAMSRTPFANMAHTQSFGYLEMSVNGTAIGEFGQLALCAGQLGVPAIFGAGDQAFTAEAEALVPGIHTVAVKRGTRPGRGDECTDTAYQERNGSAIHLQPRQACERIRAGAAAAVRRFLEAPFGLAAMEPPFRRTVVMRATENAPRRFTVDEHATELAPLMHVDAAALRPVDDEAQLRTLLVD